MTLFGNGSKKAAEKTGAAEDDRALIGENLNFSASEAYKLLRANITFSFPQTKEHECNVIGITSSLRNDGKSLNAINTAYTMALGEKKVLLMECDLRLPTIAKRLGMEPAPGVSNVLVGLCSPGDAIQRYGEGVNLDVMVSGEIPPNPSELLSSERMTMLIGELRKKYDYIILDLPPVSIVADALIVSKLTDGMVIVVRQDYTDKTILGDAVRQIEFSGCRILGFLFNAANDGRGSRRGYRRYYKRGKKENDSYDEYAK